MNLFELFVKIGAKDEASGTISKITSGLGKGLATAAKIGTAAVGAAATGIAALTKAAVDNYAEYEQLVGGVQTLFGLQGQSLEEYAATVGKTTDEALDEWLKYTTGERKILNASEEAYKTAGMSANEYMQTVTGFSAALIQGLGGDTAKAADMANLAVTDMADNANKMGTSMELIQNAYQGFAKDNFTMLDNLKLGYGGTAGEMARLINDSGVLGDAIEVTNKTVADVPFDKVIEAINVIQTRMGITGTTAKEAGRTIAGSVGSMKAAWTNLVTGFADKNADIELLIENLVETIVGDGTENNLGVIGNVLPAVETALGGIAKLIEGAAPKIIEILPGLVTRIVPSLISAATGMVDAVVKVVPDLLNTVVDALIKNAPALITAAIGLVQSLVQGIQDNYQILVDGAIQIVTQLATGILNMLPQIVKLGLDLIVSLAKGIAESIPKLIPTIVDVLLEIVEILTDKDTLQQLFDAALAIIMALAESLLDPETINQLLDAAIEVVRSLTEFLTANLSPLLNAAIQIIMSLVDYLLEPNNLKKLIETAVEIIVTIAGALVGSAGELLKAVGELILQIFAKFKKTDWGQIGRSILDGLKNGIKNAWGNLKEWFSGLFDDLIGVAKKILGIASPSKVFKKIGGFTAEGFGAGFEDEFAHVKDDMEDALNFDDASVGINASIRKVGAGAAGGAFGGTSIGDITINIDGARYSDEQSLAQAVAEAIQELTDRKEAVYA